MQRVEKEVCGRTLSFEHGLVARQSDGGVLARYGDTVILASAVYAKEPHFQQALDRPAGFKLHVSQPAVSWAEVYTNLASALTVAYTDASLMDNKPKIMSWLAAQADAANKVLQTNKEY